MTQTSTTPVNGALGRPASQVVCGMVIAGVAAILATAAPIVFALVFAVGVPYLVLTSLETKVAVYFLSLPLIGYFKVRYPDTSVQGLSDVLELAMALQLGWELATSRLRLPLLTPIGILVMSYAGFVVIESLNPVITTVGAGFDGARVYLSPMVLFFVGLRMLTEPSRFRPFLRVGVVTAIIVGAYAVKQLLLGYDGSEETFHAGQIGSRTILEHKLFSTLTAPDVFTFVAAAFTLLCLTARALRVLPRLALFGAALCGLGVAASGVRIGILALVPAATMLLVLQRREPNTRRFATTALALGSTGAVALLLLVIATPTPGSRNETILAEGPLGPAIEKLALLKGGTAEDDYQDRVNRLGEFTEYVSRHPFGAGPGLVSVFTLDLDARLGFQRPNLPKYILDQPFIFLHDYYYIDVGVELGLIPLVLFIMILVAGVRRSLAGWRAAAGDHEASAVFALTASVIVLAAVHNLTNAAFRTPQMASYVWFLLAVPVVLRAAPAVSE